MLRQADYRAGFDRLILLGDYVNEEPDSWDTLLTIKTLTDQGARALPGNIDLRVAHVPNIPEKYRPLVAWIEAMPPYIVEDDFLFVHAGVKPGLPLERQSLRDLTEIREGFWHEKIGLSYTIVFGHTPTNKLGARPGKVWYGDKRLGIDTGAKHGHRLSLVNLSDELIYSCSTAPQAMYEDVRIERFIK
ncbi:serine/threonine protein phosphatase 1 [Cohnella lupini]|uniref:Serine/threonine protein phosphatase 1 n=1 Tax=Cohnella lupini TaxID=1294267 RepID=A0A3D9IQM9_9BACL|nr:serine/threonine protein phosphatase 1 [Cohnella lupini]